jgi:2'-5' RNA ligase
MHTIANAMRYFLALQPPPPLEAKVLAFRTQWTVLDTPPHITVKAPCGLGPADTWLSTVRQICQVTSPIPVRVDGVGSFGQTVLTLHIASPEMVALHLRIINALAISAVDQATCFEGARYSPHLTLLHAQSLRKHTFSAVSQAAHEWFAAPHSFHAEKLAVYRKAPGEPYSHHLDLPLLGSYSS